VDNDCQIVEEDNVQVPWKDFIHGIDGVWRVLLTQEHKVPDFKVGQLIGVKSKCCGDGHNVYWFCGGESSSVKADLQIVHLLGDDIVFERVIWTQHSRGVLRCGISNIRFSDIIIRREGPAWCLATSGGGPQVENI
jgi:hypothetical protein